MTNHLTLVSEKDQIFAQPNFPRVFEFNEEVARAFDDMASRSIPLYREVNQSIASWASMLTGPDLRIYDLGCSTATALLAIGICLQSPCHLIGIDASEPMLERATQKLGLLPKRHHYSLFCQRLEDVAFEPAAMIILNYTLQFLPIENRQGLLNKIYASLKPGGMLFFSEKIRFASPLMQASMNWIYENFKLSTGYTETEIARKKQALEQVLVSLTLDEHITMLRKSGFCNVQTIMQWNNFVSILCIK